MSQNIISFACIVYYCMYHLLHVLLYIMYHLLHVLFIACIIYCMSFIICIFASYKNKLNIKIKNDENNN